MLQRLNFAQFNVLLIGEPGSGKTVDILKFLGSQDKEVVTQRNVNFSSATTTTLLQENIESFVEKRMGNTYGPPAGRRGIVFIDEVNIPYVNEWGDQPTNELTRQIVEERGVYALDKPGEYHNLADLSFLAAMPLPGGGRNDIPARLKGHYVTINITLPAADQLDHIFGTIVKGHYKQTRGFSDTVCEVASKLVSATRNLWTATKAKMLPTPAKFHYIFNLRDLSRITQGFINSSNDDINTYDETKLIHLWANECSRVLPDKFTTNEDVMWFRETLVKCAAQEVGQDLANEIYPAISLNEDGETQDANNSPGAAGYYFCDFMRDPPEVEANEDDEGEDLPEVVEPKIYEPVYDRTQLIDRINMKMGQYNEKYRRTPLDLVLFEVCIEHVLRISRIIRTPRGNALLVGIGGSGKQSCAKLASFIAGYDIFQIQISRGYNVSNFDDDLKLLYRKAGVEGVGVTFLFTDNDVKDEVFLERINNILTSGEVPSLFARDEIENIINDVRTPFKKENPRLPDTNDALWGFFLQRVKANLHVCLCFSPVGDKFRSRARKFPGLISGCTTDWFQAWPREALLEVARKYIILDKDFEIYASSDEVINKLIEHVATVHLDMNLATQQYFERYRRQTYVTPKSYLSFLSTYKKLYVSKRSELQESYQRLKVGLDKLETAANDVAKMRIDLQEKEKDLAVAQGRAAEMLKEITSSTAEAEKKKAEVQVVADALKIKADEIAAQKADAQAGLDKALPALEAAEKALEAIDANDINTVRRLAKPPHLIQRIMDGVLLLMNQPIDKITPDPDFPIEKKILKPSWQKALTLMTQSGFLSSLLTFARDAITDETCELLLPYIEMSDFTYEAAKKSSGNVAGLLQWVNAMNTYHFIALEVEPKRAAVREAEASYKAAMVKLTAAQDDLASKQAALDALKAKYDAAMAEKKRLQDEAELTARRLDSASALINGLSGERKRWSQQAKELDEAITRLVGDVALCSAFLSYCGAFNQEFRQHLITEVWLRDIQERKLPYTRNIENDLCNFLTTEAQIGEWRLQGLPTDELSTQNGLIVTTSTRYPLLVDPQGQAAVWIKNKEKGSLKVTTQNSKYFRQMLEDALGNGHPLLIEDVEEELDPVLDPVLEKQFIRVGKGIKVKLGDKECDVTKGFMLYITSKLPNPRYAPETYAKTSVIDFAVTFGGLESQLLARTVNLERRDLEVQRGELLEMVNANKKQALKLEADLLEKLSSTKGNLLDDASLVDVLNMTKQTTEQVKEKIASAVETERKINEAREEYLVVATRGSILYFLISEMPLVNHMYQTSLKQFLQLFDQCVQEAEASPITTRRISNIISQLTLKIFQFITRGLFERDKLLFGLNLCLKVDMKAGRISGQEFTTFIRGGAALDLNNVRVKPAQWIPDMAWLNIIALSSLPIFAQLPSQIAENDSIWKQWYDTEAPEQSNIPPEYAGRINVFQKLLLVRCFREDRTMLAATEYITSTLGPEFAESVGVNMEDVLTIESNSHTPLCFLLSLGSDPTSQLETLSKKKKIELRCISMGQGQEIAARKLISEAVLNGWWVMISNSHLGLKFMSEIEQIVDDISNRKRIIMASQSHQSSEENGESNAPTDGNTETNLNQTQENANEVNTNEDKAEKQEKKEKKADKKADKKGKKGESKEESDEANITNSPGTGGVFSLLQPNQLPNPNFRLILTTEPHPEFPIGLLQKCIKLTNDPPTGCRAGLKRSYQFLTQDLLESVDRPQWLPLVYTIAFIHTTVQERRKYGPLGWAIPYEFSNPDFTASIQFLQSYLYGLDPRKNTTISWHTIRYMISEVHYGGRITDDFDRRLMKTYADVWLNAKVLEPTFSFAPSLPQYRIPKHSNITEARMAIDNLPSIDKPLIYGMHPNAELTFRSKQALDVLNTILSTQPKGSTGSGSNDKKKGDKKKGKDDESTELSREDTVLRLVRDILTKLPPNYDTKVTVRQQVQKQGGKAKPLNIFLLQEVDRMQNVLVNMRNTINDLQLAIAGTIVMSESLQQTLDALYDAKVPPSWLKISWPSSTLGFWISDVIGRCAQFTDWLVKGRPNSYWLNGFFNPTGFLTAMKQEITRAHQGWALDKVNLRTTVMKYADKSQVTSPPAEGVYIHGLFLDGAAWDKKNMRLVDQQPKVLFVLLPVLLVDATDSYQKPPNTYDCPVYKTQMRTGLTYIFTVQLPIKEDKDEKPSKWILRGAALLCNTQ